MVWRRELLKVPFVNVCAWMLHSFTYVHFLLGIQKCLAEIEVGLKMIFLSDSFKNFISISYVTKYALTALF